MAYVVRGNIHIHSNLSDGTASIEEIAKIANREGLDFIIVNDHEHLKGKKMGLEGYYGDTLVLIGQEVNRLKNHYLVMGIEEEINNNEESPREIVDEVKEKGGLGFIAHPFEKGSPLVNRGRTYPWIDFNMDGFTGMEIANYSSAWRDGVKKPLQALYANFINDLAYMEYPNPESYRKWKELTKEKRVVGIFGSDAHAPIYKIGPLAFKILSYKYLFRSGNNYLYTKKPIFSEVNKNNYKKAEKLLLSSLQKGNLYMCLDRIEKGDGLKVFMKDEKGDKFLPGDILTPGKHTIFAGFEKEKKNNKKHMRIEEPGGKIRTFPLPLERDFELSNGTYHINISHPGHEKWIILNPFYAWEKY